MFGGRLASPVTINVAVSWGSVGGGAIPSGKVGASIANFYEGLSFAQVSGHMSSSASRNSLDTAFAGAVRNLPKTTPSGLSSYAVTSAEAKTLGLVAGNQTAYDGYIGFGSGYTYGF